MISTPPQSPTAEPSPTPNEAPVPGPTRPSAPLPLNDVHDIAPNLFARLRRITDQEARLLADNPDDPTTEARLDRLDRRYLATARLLLHAHRIGQDASPPRVRPAQRDGHRPLSTPHELHTNAGPCPSRLSPQAPTDAAPHETVAPEGVGAPPLLITRDAPASRSRADRRSAPHADPDASRPAPRNAHAPAPPTPLDPNPGGPDNALSGSRSDGRLHRPTFAPEPHPPTAAHPESLDAITKRFLAAGFRSPRIARRLARKHLTRNQPTHHPP